MLGDMMKAFGFAFNMCFVAEIIKPDILLESTPDASRATAYQEGDDVSTERIHPIGTKQQVTYTS